MKTFATIYKHPDSRKEIIELSNISKEDADFFHNHNIKLAVEEWVGDDYMIYAEWEGTGIREFSDGRTCLETLTALKEQCEQKIMKKVKLVRIDNRAISYNEETDLTPILDEINEIEGSEDFLSSFKIDSDGWIIVEHVDMKKRDISRCKLILVNNLTQHGISVLEMPDE